MYKYIDGFEEKINIYREKKRDYMIKRNYENFELLFYKHIGVLWFKKIVLHFEGILHINRGYRLLNYHPERLTTEGINNFLWLLVYNCTLHLMSIGLAVLYYLIVSIGKIRIVPLNIIRICR